MRCSNFVKIAFRNIILHRGFSLVSLIGLSLGMAMALLVLAYVRYETTYDTHFPQSGNIYRLNSYGQVGNDTIQSALTALPLTKQAVVLPGVVAATRLFPASKKLVKSEHARFIEPHFFYADKGFFKVFELSFLVGDANTVFSDTNSVVLSLATAKRFFGTRNPVGETLELDNGVKLEVTGIYRDLPENLHFKADLIANWELVEKRMQSNLKQEYEGWNDNWFTLSCYTYIRTGPDVEMDSLVQRLNSQTSELMRLQKETLQDGGDPGFDKMEIISVPQAIGDIHLSTNLDHEIQKGANATYVGIFAGIAIFILVITAINFMNITTARASRRFKEIAVRKTFGAGRRHLVVQFFTESILFCLLALVIALVFMELFFERFSLLFDIPMGQGMFLNHLQFGWVVLTTLLVGAIAGSYPSFFFSVLQADKIFKGQVKTGRFGFIVRGILVAFQICIAVALMSVSLSMHNQLKFLKSAPLGYDPDRLVAVEREYALGSRIDSVKADLKGRALVEGVSSVQFLPGEETSILSYRNMADSAQVILMSTNVVDSMFFVTMGARMAHGRAFKNEEGADSSQVVINESAARLLGYTEQVPCRIEMIGSKKMSVPLIFNVVGVVKDIHYESMKHPVKPMVFVQAKKGSPADYLLIRFKAGGLESGILETKALWSSVVPDDPFVFFRLSDKVEGFYREEQRFARIGAVLAVIALVFAILGLIGMVSFVVQSKHKAMEISRVLASSTSMMLVGTFRGCRDMFSPVSCRRSLFLPMSSTFGCRDSFTPSHLRVIVWLFRWP
jgi:putative ABC transport system permease protein